MKNPYRSPRTAAPRAVDLPTQTATRRKKFLGRLFVGLTWAYPFLVVASIYLAWLTAWIRLGHPPRLYLDDPSATGSIGYSISGWLVVGVPFAMVLGIGNQLVYLQKGERRRIPYLVLLVSLWGIAFVLLRWDPIGVVNWWFD